MFRWKNRFINKQRASSVRSCTFDRSVFCKWSFGSRVYDVERPLLPRVNLRILDGFGEVGDVDGLVLGEVLSESLPVEEDLRRVSARMSSRLTLRCEDDGATEVSSISVNLEMAILWCKWRICK